MYAGGVGRREGQVEGEAEGAVTAPFSCRVQSRGQAVRSTSPPQPAEGCNQSIWNNGDEHAWLVLQAYELPADPASTTNAATRAGTSVGDLVSGHGLR